MTTLTIKRPNGVIETVKTNYTHINDILFAQIKTATAAAGKGEVLSCNNPVVKKRRAAVMLKDGWHLWDGKKILKELVSDFNKGEFLTLFDDAFGVYLEAK
jgi:hypothetical protein